MRKSLIHIKMHRISLFFIFFFLIIVQVYAARTDLSYTFDLADLEMADASEVADTLMLWNLATIHAYNISLVTNATLCLDSVSVVSMTGYNYFALSNIIGTWSESTSVSGINLLTYNESVSSIAFNQITAGAYSCINVTQQVQNAYNARRNMSLKISCVNFTTGTYTTKWDNELFLGDNPVHYISLNDRENSLSTGRRPYLNITFLAANISLTIQSPLNQSYIPGNVFMNWTMIGVPSQAANCSYNLDGANTSLINTSNATLSNLSVGQHSVFVRCYDSENLVFLQSPSVSFRILSPCLEDWRRMYSDCVGGYSSVFYVDFNVCNTTSNLSVESPPNGTIINCTIFPMIDEFSALFDHTFISSDVSLIGQVPSPSENASIMLRWNLTTLPWNIEDVIFAELCLYGVVQSVNISPYVNISLVYGAWNDSTFASSINALIKTDNEIRNLSGNVTGSYNCWDVKRLLNLSLGTSHFEPSFRIDMDSILMQNVSYKSSDFLRIGCDSSNDSLDLFARFENRINSEGTGNEPYLMVNFTYRDVIQVVIDIPENETYYGSQVLVKFHVIGQNYSNCRMHLDGGDVLLIGNTSVPVSLGQHYINISCLDESSFNRVNSQTIAFSMVPTCTENWRMIYGDCVEGYMFITYADLNSCNTSVNITQQAVQNGTYLYCGGNSQVEGSWVIQYRAYPYVSLARDNPEGFFIELYQNGTKTIFPNITATLVSMRNGTNLSFTLTKDLNYTRYAGVVNFSQEDAGDNFSIRFHANIEGIEDAVGMLYIRNSSCLLQFRLWNDRNQSSPYKNEFAYLLARPKYAGSGYTLANYIMLIPAYDKLFGDVPVSDVLSENSSLFTDYKISDGEWFYAAYKNGLANMTLYDSDTYEFKLVDGSFVFMNNYGHYLIEKQDIDTSLGTYQILCNPNVVQVRDYYVSRFDLHFFESITLLLWVSVFLLVSFVVAFIALRLTGSFQMAGMVFIGVLAMLMSIFFGINLMGILFTNYR